MTPSGESRNHFEFLSELLLSVHRPAKGRRVTGSAQSESENRIVGIVSGLTENDIERLSALATTNHVIVRAFGLLEPMVRAEANSDTAEFIADHLRAERRRIDHALRFLAQICEAFQKCGCPVTVIKSLDHWPDLGSDLDLYTDADSGKVVQVMTHEFGAKVAERSWGDRLANKWNFIVPGLPELVEVHVRRLGQTGEQTAFSESLILRTRLAQIGTYSLRVLAAEDRIVISTLQRMYRHFYIRLCDVIDNARLLDAEEVDFDDLHAIGTAAGLWEGIATYLVIVSQYVESYRGFGVPLPSLVSRSARFDVSPIRFRRDFLRVPIVPHSVNLYAGELKTLLLSGQLRNSLRLSLLPGLATAAALEMKITGSDKGIW